MILPRLVFLLDTPNLWRGRALAGTPARVLALAEYARRAGAAATLVVCDRGADYGEPGDWPVDVLLVHPTDFYVPSSLARMVEPLDVDFVVMCEAEAVEAHGRELTEGLGARLIYDVHDDEAVLAGGLGEPPQVVDRYRATQRAALGAADFVIVLTPHERRLCAGSGIAASRVALLPNGADRSRRCWGPDVGAARLVFVGNLFYAPNARALAAIRGSILPSLRAGGFGAWVRVIGRGPVEVCRGDGDCVEFTGRVKSINRALRGCTLGVAPLTAGSGAKMKVLDYMAAGLPVVGTSEAVTGLPTGHPGVVVEDDLDMWPALLAGLLADPPTLREVGRAGRRCIERELSWQRIGARLVEQARGWMAARPARAPLSAGGHGGETPRWLAEHATQGALGTPEITEPGRARWLRRDAPALSRSARREITGG